MSWQEIPGYSDFLPIYDEAVTHFGDGAVFVEVGVAIGHSVAYLARKVIDAGHKNTRIYAVDPWAGNGRNGEQQAALGANPGGDFGLFCRTMLEHAPEELERINVLRATSLDAAAMLSIVDMVMIDGDHSAAAVEADCKAWVRSVRPGLRSAWLCGDDYRPDTDPQLIEGLHRVFPKERVEICGLQGRTWRVKL